MLMRKLMERTSFFPTPPPPSSAGLHGPLPACSDQWQAQFTLTGRASPEDSTSPASGPLPPPPPAGRVQAKLLSMSGTEDAVSMLFALYIYYRAPAPPNRGHLRRASARAVGTPGSLSTMDSGKP